MNRRLVCAGSGWWTDKIGVKTFPSVMSKLPRSCQKNDFLGKNDAHVSVCVWHSRAIFATETEKFAHGVHRQEWQDITGSLSGERQTPCTIHLDFARKMHGGFRSLGSDSFNRTPADRASRWLEWDLRVRGSLLATSLSDSNGAKRTCQDGSNKDVGKSVSRSEGRKRYRGTQGSLWTVGLQDAYWSNQFMISSLWFRHPPLIRECENWATLSSITHVVSTESPASENGVDNGLNDY